jgi:hypothetical protein
MKFGGEGVIFGRHGGDTPGCIAGWSPRCPTVGQDNPRESFRMATTDPIAPDNADVEAHLRERLKSDKAKSPVRSSKTVEASFAAFERIQQQSKLFKRDWLPFIDGVREVTMDSIQFLRDEARNTNVYTPEMFLKLDGTSPDYKSPIFQIAWRVKAGTFPWFEYLADRRRKELLEAVRELGEERADVLKWYEDLDEYQRERWTHPITLWRKWNAYNNKEVKDAAKGKKKPEKGIASSDSEQLQKLTERYAKLDQEFEAYKTANEKPSDFAKQHKAVVEKCNALVKDHDRATTFLKALVKLVDSNKVTGLSWEMKKTLIELVS